MAVIARCDRCGGSPEFEGECPTCGYTIQTYVSESEVESLRAQLRGAVEALREVERARHLEGKDAGTKADIMARIARDALHQHGGQ